MSPMSNAPSDAVEGGDFPRGNLLVVKSWFGVHKYEKRGTGKNSDGTDIMVPVMGAGGGQATAVAAFIDLRNDEGVVFKQFYSIGDPARFTVAADGSEIEQGTLKTNCNYFQLTKALVNAGYPENRLREESKIAALLEGLYAKWDQETAKRGDSSQLVLPQELYQFPWGPATSGAPQAPGLNVDGATSETATATIVAPESSSEVVGKVVESAIAMLDDPATDGKHKRDDLSMYIFQTRGAEEKMDMMTAVMSAEVETALAVNGVGLKGEELRKV